jgi:hypothetical protein
MTPDWATKPTDVPYANFGNPQSLNLYSYVQNNPTTVGDPDGHETQDTLDPQAAQEAGGDFEKVVMFAQRFANHPFGQAVLDLIGLKGGGEAAEALAAKGAVSTITENAAKGAAFEKAVVKATEATDTDVAEQVTLKTQSGVKTKMDVVSKTDSGTVRLQEAKSSAEAPLTRNQKLAHPEIEKTGA